jgi:hypothetical protein
MHCVNFENNKFLQELREAAPISAHRCSERPLRADCNRSRVCSVLWWDRCLSDGRPVCTAWGHLAGQLLQRLGTVLRQKCGATWITQGPRNRASYNKHDHSTGHWPYSGVLSRTIFRNLNLFPSLATTAATQPDLLEKTRISHWRAIKLRHNSDIVVCFYLGNSPAVWILYADVSEHFVCSIFISKYIK